jgi:hypothetical protein
MKVKVIKATLNSYWYSNLIGQEFEVEPYENEICPQFIYQADTEYGKKHFHKDDVEIINEEKIMKREDKASIEITLQEATSLYALTSRANGNVGCSLYKTLKSLVDVDGGAYNKCLAGKFDLIDYRSIQEEFEATIFDRRTAEQIQLEVLQEKIADLTREAEKLQGLISK